MHERVQRWRRLGRGFLGQGLLILLAVILLAGLGLLSIQKDRSAIEQEARERAQQIADQLAHQLIDQVVSLFEFEPAKAEQWIDQQEGEAGFAIEIDAQGRLVQPEPYPALPAPPPLNDTAQEQALWRQAQSAEFRQPEFPAAIEHYRQLIQVAPQGSLAGPAHFNIGLLQLKMGDSTAAARTFLIVREQYPDSTTESGLSLGALAGLKLMDLALTRSNDLPQLNLEEILSGAVRQPTLLTPHLLSRAGALDSRLASKWEKIWKHHETARALYDAARPVWTSGLFWFSSGERQLQFRLPLAESSARSADVLQLSARTDWLAMRRQTPTQAWLLCRPGADMSERILNQVKASKIVPSYFGVGIELAGKTLISREQLPVWATGSSGKGGGPSKVYLDPAKYPPALMAAATSDSSERVRVGVYLTSPSTLFARHQARTVRFGLLIALSTIIALYGLGTAWKAFVRQERLAEMKTNFVSSVSHELRAPIASMRLLAENLERGRVSEAGKQREYFHFIVQECRRLSSLIENVLDFSRIEQGRKQYEFEPTDVNGLIQQTIQLMAPAATERDIQWITQIHDRIRQPACEPLLDGRAIQQALINLIDNAIKFSQPGSPILIGADWAQLEGAAESSVVLWVEDQGPGIQAREQARIFERFYRAGSELRRETQGVGIGLSIVQHIAQAHGGRVTVRSEPGKGSRFTLELPYRPARSNHLQPTDD